MGKEIFSELRLENVVFDHIEFDRKDFKKTNADPEIRLKVQVGENEDSVHRTNLICIITKKDEYDINISLSGYFTFQSDSSLDEKNKKIKELSEFKDNMCNEIDNNPYSYYGVNENDF